MIKKIIVICLPFLLCSCVVPVQPRPYYHNTVTEGVYAPQGVVYVAPTIPMPSPGYIWQYDAHIGWNWYHPRYGWYRHH